MAEDPVSAYRVTFDILNVLGTLVAPLAIAYFVYRLTRGDSEKETRRHALLSLFERLQQMSYFYMMWRMRAAQFGNPRAVQPSQEMLADTAARSVSMRNEVGTNAKLVECLYKRGATWKLQESVSAAMVAAAQHADPDVVKEHVNDACASIYRLLEYQRDEPSPNPLPTSGSEKGNG